MKKIFLSFVLLSLIGLSGFAQIPTNGLVGYWPFNGNANDESGNSNNGTVNGATLTADMFGNANTAYSFDGTNDYIKVSNSSSLNIQNSISLVAWIKTDDPHTSTENNAAHIVGKHFTNYSRQYSLAAEENVTGTTCSIGNNYCFEIFNTSNVAYCNSDGVEYFYDNLWHLLVGTYDNATGKQKFYIDGVLRDSSTVGNINLQQSTVPLGIGCYWDNSSGTIQRGFFHGVIDEVCIYNRALTDNEISTIYGNCSNMPIVSISGLNASYNSNDPIVSMIGTPTGGTFYGVGVIGNSFNPSIAGIGDHTIVYVYSNGSCSKATCENVSIATKIGVIQSQNMNIDIIPNPNNGKFNISFTVDKPENFTIQVFDALSKQVYSEKKNKYQGIYNNTVDLSNLSNGIYTVNVKVGEKTTTEKISITK
ncbi:MAG: T9SS type A sorting domain-containing protein [Bacteroidia bacterium]|nr:T9SS type A sorting domain-containing protein [Bacteroidia bacterium]